MSSVGSFFSYVNDARSHEPEVARCSLTRASECKVYFYCTFRRGSVRKSVYTASGFLEHTKTGEFVAKPLPHVSKIFAATNSNMIASRTRLSHDGTHLYQQKVQTIVHMHNKRFSFGGNYVVNSGIASKLNI